MEGRAWLAGRMMLRALRAGRLGFCLVCFGHTLPGHAKVLLTRLVWPLLSSLLGFRLSIQVLCSFLG